MHSYNNIHFGVSNLCYKITASLLAVKNNSLLPSQSIFNEIKSIYDTGLFHEIEAEGKDCGVVLISTVIQYLQYCLYSTCAH